MIGTRQWVDEWQSVWQSRLHREYPQANPEAQQGIIRWLLGDNFGELNQLAAGQLLLVEQQANRRYQILRQRYLGVNPRQAYSQLLNRLGALVACCPPIRHQLSRHRPSRQAVAALIQEVLQNLLQQDVYCQRQMHWIAGCTDDTGLREALFLASLEEYCLRVSGKQPLFIERLIACLRQKQERKLEAIEACA